jgi:hypothetical protein
MLESKELVETQVALHRKQAGLYGHILNGQCFPVDFITRRVYELSYGYMNKGETHYLSQAASGYRVCLFVPLVRRR